jgi:hypothetical protein
MGTAGLVHADGLGAGLVDGLLDGLLDSLVDSLVDSLTAGLVVSASRRVLSAMVLS